MPDPSPIIALNRRGEGVTAEGQPAPGLLPGDVVGAPPLAPRATPICPYFGTCGGCAAQHMPAELYAEWKRQSVVGALAREGLEIEVGRLIDAHGIGRRRATFHARSTPAGRVEVGFMRSRAHEIVAIEFCPLFAPELSTAPAVARAVAEALKATAKPLDIQTTATLTGLDVDVRGSGPLGPAETRKLLAAAERFDLARLSNHGVALIERRAPVITFGPARATLPAGGFLQATAEGEAALARLALEAVRGASRVADLFCGAGAFALRLAETHTVFAADSDPAAIGALRRAAGAKPIEAAQRDLMRDPVPAATLDRFDGALFDPPRAGAEAQAREIARSRVPLVVAISCNAETFARDARLLVEAGFACDGVTPLDQFRYSPHVELFAAFHRRVAKATSKRRKGVLG